MKPAPFDYVIPNSIDEAINGSWTVVITVLFLMGFLAGADLVLGRVARTILSLGAG